MKSFLLHSGLSILFSLTVICSVLFLVLLNDNFILRELEHNNYYKELDRKMESELTKDYPDYNCYVDQNILKKDMESYIERHFNTKKIDSAIICDEEIDLDEWYQERITFSIFKGINTRKYYYILSIITIILIFIIGSIFIKTQKHHDISIIFIISFFILTIVYGSIYLFIDLPDSILNIILNKANHYLLGVSIILLEIGLYNKIKNKPLFKTYFS